MLVWFLLIVVFFGAARSLDLEGDFEVTVPKLSLVHDRKARSTSGVSAQQEDVLIYTLTAFGESVRLHLRRSHDFIATSLVVEYHKREGKRMMEPGNNYALRRCFYSGFAAGHNGRMDATPAAFSVCGGLVRNVWVAIQLLLSFACLRVSTCCPLSDSCMAGRNGKNSCCSYMCCSTVQSY
jgi:hypothetical protein